MGPLRVLLVALALAAGFLAARSAHVPPTVAPAATGEPEFAISAPGKVRGELLQGPSRFVIHGVVADCGNVLFKGRLESKSKTLSLSPENYQCTARILRGPPADFYRDYACNYILHDLRPLEDGGWKADVDLRCPGELPGYAFEIYETEEERAGLCATWILAKPDAGTAVIRNLAGARRGIEVRWDLPALEYEISTPAGARSSLLCGSLPTPTGTDASFRGVAQVFAHNRNTGRPLGIWVEG